MQNSLALVAASRQNSGSWRVAQPVADGKTGYNVSGYYNNFNAGKLSFTLNLSHPMSRDIALRLIAKCDIVMENYAPRVFEKWGLTYDAMREVNPSVIFLREPMMGTWGPHRDFAGFGAVLSPIAGLSHLSGYPDRTPIARPPAGRATAGALPLATARSLGRLRHGAASCVVGYLGTVQLVLAICQGGAAGKANWSAWR